MCRAARPRLVSGGSQTEKANHWFEIAIVLQQQVATLDAEGADDKIDRLADRAAPAAEKAVVRRRFDRQVGVEQRHRLKSPTNSGIAGISSRRRLTGPVTASF